jgi:peptide deformylase
MTILEITQPDNPILRKKVSKVTNFDSKFQTLIDNMIETMITAPGVGLAGPQVDENQRVIVVYLPVDEDDEEIEDGAGEIYVVANPKIIKTSKTTISGIEGCLSIPGYVGEVDRYDMVVVTGQDRYGKPFRIKARGWLARVFQHEIDHLDGRLFIDIANKIWPAPEQDEDGNPIERPPYPWEGQIQAAIARIQREREQQETTT